MKIQKLKMEDIVEKKFNKKTIGGINQLEVDEFLDVILDDYEFFEGQIKELKKINEELRSENFKIKMNVLKNATHTLDFDEIEEIKNKEKKETKSDKEVLNDRLSNIERVLETLSNK